MLRENFVERVFAYRRMRDLFRDGWTRGALVAFQTTVKLQVIAHEPAAYRELGVLVAHAKETRGRCEWKRDYNECRPHGALDGLTPSEFAANATNEGLREAKILNLKNGLVLGGASVRRALLEALRLLDTEDGG